MLSGEPVWLRYGQGNLGALRSPLSHQVGDPQWLKLAGLDCLP